MFYPLTNQSADLPADVHLFSLHVSKFSHDVAHMTMSTVLSCIIHCLIHTVTIVIHLERQAKKFSFFFIYRKRIKVFN